MQVMAFNIRGSFHDDGANNWDQRRDLNIATILKYDPDIIGFQEAQQGNFDDYAVPLAAYDFEPGPLSIRDAEDYHRVPVYWKQADYRKLDSGGFYLSETPDTWSVGWDAMFPRAVTWVRLQSIKTGDAFVVMNTHFPHERGADKDATRDQCAKLVLAKLRSIAPQEPVIVMADFNAGPQDPAYKTLTGGDLVDTYMAAGHTVDVNTFHGFQGEAFAYDGVRIDWILVRGFSTQHCTVITDADITDADITDADITDATQSIHPSDHYPVLAEIVLAVS